MNVRKKFPKLFKNLARHFGARKAKHILLELDKNPHALDADCLSTSVIWPGTVQGFQYWKKLHKAYNPFWGA